MANIKGFKFFDFDSTNEISNILTNPSRGESLTIEVNDNGTGIGLSLVVQGKSDLQDEENQFNIAAISLADYSISPKIEKAGLYVIPLDGIVKCRMVSENGVGGFKVYSLTIRQ